MRALLLIAHGSRDDNSNRIVVDLAADLAEQLRGQYDCVKPVFLEFAEPGATKGIADCVSCGVDEIVVLPYFLAPGRHVTRDVPGLVKAAREAHRDVSFTLLPYAGSAPKLVDAMADFARMPSSTGPELAVAG
jgi:sirohydrochlorin ferrochelatase